MPELEEFENPYVDELPFDPETDWQYGPSYENGRQINNPGLVFETRKELVRKYSWAIPNQAAIKTLVNHSPVIEIGAGTGYWARLVNEAGGEILAVDKDPPSLQDWWYAVVKHDESALKFFEGRALFLCWPEAGGVDAWAADAVELYQGDTLIYVGEPRGGCTAGERFFDVVEERFVLEERVEIPQWLAIHDELRVYREDSDE